MLVKLHTAHNISYICNAPTVSMLDMYIICVSEGLYVYVLRDEKWKYI
jgi:hypothetical protein